MNIAGFKPKIKVVPSKVTTVRVQETKKLAPLPSKAKAESAKRHQAQRARGSPAQSRGSPSTPRSGPATPNSDWQDSTRLKVKRKPSRSHSPAHQRLVSSDEDDSDNGKGSGSENLPAKKQKLDNSIDVNRRLRSRKAFDSDDGVFTMIHAADLPFGQHKTKLGPDIGVGKVIVELQYPSASQRERYV
jgi:H3 lysine-79-specific histone-lysine N-methyltransferase